MLKHFLLSACLLARRFTTFRRWALTGFMESSRSFTIGVLASPQQECSLLCKYVVPRASHPVIANGACLGSHTRLSRGRFLECLLYKLTILVFLKFPHSIIQLHVAQSNVPRILFLDLCHNCRNSFPSLLNIFL